MAETGENRAETGEKGKKKLRILLRTFGCQMNVRDSEIILGMLQERGYVPVDNEQEADVVLFNTCSVREHAEARVWGKVGMLKKFMVDSLEFIERDSGSETTRRKAQPVCRAPQIIGIVGCMAQNYQGEIFQRLPQVNLVCGPANIYDIPDLLARAEKGERRILAVDRAKRPLRVDCGAGLAMTEKYKVLDCPVKPGDDKELKQNRLKAFVSIMYGCNNFCSYCIVPYVRGEEISRPVKHILDEVKYLAAQGVKEITLLGQNVNSYGKDLRGKVGFVGLLEKVNRVEGIERIRFVTSHPKDASLELFKAMGGLPKVCEHLHLPLQSGSDRILRLMNRGYALRQYLKLVDSLRRIVPQCGITTDVIVGFPGETAADFAKTCGAMQRVRFDEAFIFKYSPRQKTKAAGLRDDVLPEEKCRRNQTLLKLQAEISLQKNQVLVGKTVEVLVEGKGRRIGADGRRAWLEGRNRANKVVLFPGGEDLAARIVSVRINKVTLHTLAGELDEEKD